MVHGGGGGGGGSYICIYIYTHTVRHVCQPVRTRAWRNRTKRTNMYIECPCIHVGVSVWACCTLVQRCAFIAKVKQCCKQGMYGWSVPKPRASALAHFRQQVSSGRPLAVLPGRSLVEEMCVYVCIYIYVYVYTYVYIHIFVYIYIHTYIYIYMKIADYL